MLYWSYEAEACRAAGALPPERMQLPYGVRDRASPFGTRDYATIWRAIERGYEVKPGDCPPVRLISRYGVVVRCPGRVRARRLPERSATRSFSEEHARFGIIEVGGDAWPVGDSGFVASWIAGSEFIKVQTGIGIHFPADGYLYQGPIPNRGLVDDSPVEVMAGMEYVNDNRVREIAGRRYGLAHMNVIVRLPPADRVLELSRGTPLAWVFPVHASSQVQLSALGDPANEP